MNEDLIEWECPLCGDVCYDPLRHFPTECRNHHQVELVGGGYGCTRIIFRNSSRQENWIS